MGYVGLARYFHWRKCEGLRKLRNIGCTHMVQSRHFVLAFIPSRLVPFAGPCVVCPSWCRTSLYDRGSDFGNGGDGFESAVLSMKDAWTDFLRNGKADRMDLAKSFSTWTVQTRGIAELFNHERLGRHGVWRLTRLVQGQIESLRQTLGAHALSFSSYWDFVRNVEFGNSRIR